MLSAQVQRASMVCKWRNSDCNSNQLLSSESSLAEWQRRLVQHASPALRHGGSRVRADCNLPSRNRPRPVPQSSVCQNRRSAFHRQWQPLLPSGTGNKCGRRGRCAFRLMQGNQHWLVSDAKKLGPELAVQWPCNGRPSVIVHDHH